MPAVLLIAEHADGALNPATAKAMSCARQLGDVDVAVFAADASSVAAAAAKLDGARKVLKVESDANAHALAAVMAPQIAELAADYDGVIMPSTTFGKDVLPRAAALMGSPQVSDLMEVLGPRRFKRPIYAGNVITTVEVPEGCPIIATARIASFQPSGEQAACPIEDAAISAELPTHTRFVELEAQGGERPDLQSAQRVVSGGRALASGDNFKLIYDLADALGAGVGASRAAVDAGYVANDMQVGQTGKIIAPDLYIAIGISGAIQHITGIKDAGTIVAINKDTDAPIFEIADIGLVGDLFEIVPQLIERLKTS